MTPHIDIHEGRGPYLLLLHGFLSSRAQWAANLEGLKRFSRPVVVELWGHGRSPVPAETKLYTVDAWIGIFERLREQLGAERWYVCGQSFGAGITMRYCLAHPERIAGQAWTNSVSAMEPSLADADGLASLTAKLESEDGNAVLQSLPYHPRFARRLPEAVLGPLLEDAESLSPVAVARLLRGIVPGLCVAEELHRIAVPTLLVNGRFEARFQPLRDRFAGALPSANIVDIDSGHSINAEAPEAFNAALEAFLKSRET